MFTEDDIIAAYADGFEDSMYAHKSLKEFVTIQDMYNVSETAVNVRSVINERLPDVAI